MMSEITKKAPRTESPNDGETRPPTAPTRAPGGFWSFMKTFFVGTAGLALLAVAGTLAGSAWLTANQREEAEKPEPWVNPSFTTTAVTTGGMLARWMDNDGNLENGHSYIKGIYNLWKQGSGKSSWLGITTSPGSTNELPPLWRAEFIADLKSTKLAQDAELQKLRSRIRNDAAKASLELMEEVGSEPGVSNRR